MRHRYRYALPYSRFRDHEKSNIKGCDSIPLLASDDNQGMESMKFEKEGFPGFQGEEPRVPTRLPEVDFVTPTLA